MKKLIFATAVAALSTAPVFAGEIEYAHVVSATPIYRDVRIEQPRQQCHDERVVYREGYRADPGALLVGAVLGGVIGHQFGGGRGNAVATGAGAVIGANVAAQNAYGYGGGERVSYRPVCEDVSEYRVEQRVQGYDVEYRYHGRMYHTQMPYDPGERIAVNVDVQPVDYRY